MATLKERATEAILALKRAKPDAEVTWRMAEEWLTRHYGAGHGVSDGTFYNARRDLPEQKTVARNEVAPPEQHVSVQVSEKVETPQTLTEQEVTFAELRAMSEFCKANGGRARVLRIMRCLADLTD